LSSPVVFSYRLDGLGKASEESNLKKNSEGLLWTHLDANHVNIKDSIKKFSDLDPIIVDALIAAETRPRMLQSHGGLLLILRGVNLNEDSRPEDMVSIRLWIDSQQIISLRKFKLKAVQDIESKLKLGNGPRDSGSFICMLISRLFERMQPVISELDEMTDEIEENLLESPDKNLRNQIIEIRKKSIMFRRYMSPQKDAISQLLSSDVNFLTPEHKRQIQESLNHITRYIEELEAIRERAQIVKDELSNILAEKLNKNMYVLSIIGAIFLPLGFLTGLLGINVGGIPGANYENAFSIFLAILFIIVFIQILIFKKYKWF
jgi:zinc transporter